MVSIPSRPEVVVLVAASFNLRQEIRVAASFNLRKEDRVAAGFSLRLFTQVKACGYQIISEESNVET